MVRQWRIEFLGALYHVMSRENNHQDIFLSGDNQYSFLSLLGIMSDRLMWRYLSKCE